MSGPEKIAPAGLSDLSGSLDLEVVGLQLLSISISLLERTKHDVAVCHAQMARDVLLSGICSKATFNVSMQSDGNVDANEPPEG